MRIVVFSQILTNMRLFAVGRPKGSKNRPKNAPFKQNRKRTHMAHGAPKGQVTLARLTVKQALEGVFDDIGGRVWLAQVARDHPVEFLKVWAKMLPLEIQVAQVQPVNVQVNLHKKQPLVLDNDTGQEVMPENAGLYRDIRDLVSRD